MILNREQEPYYGRGFSQPNSFLANLERWIEAPLVAPPVPSKGGGAGWYIIDDGTGESPAYIVVSNHDWNEAGDTGVGDDPNRFDDPHKIIRIVESASAGIVTVEGWAFWDRDSHVGYGALSTVDITTADDQASTYDFRGGPTFLSIGAYDVVAANWKFFLTSDWDGDLRYLEGPSVAAPIVGAISGSGGNVVVQFTGNNGPAGTPTANNFTVGKYYYIYDFNRNAVVDYQKVVAKEIVIDNTITFEALRADFPSGSIVTAYTHRFVNVREQFPLADILCIPYCSSKYPSNINDVFRPTYANRCAIALTANSRIMNRNYPNDRGDFYVANPFIAEYKNASDSTSADMNRVYGQLSSCYLSLKTGLSIMSVGRTIDGSNYMYAFDFFNNNYMDNGPHAVLIPDFDSIT